MAGPVSAQAPTAPASSTTQRQQVQEFVRAYADAANRSDVTAYMEMYTQKPELIAINDGEITRGWNSLRDEANRTLGLEGSFRISVGSIDVIGLGPSRAIAAFPYVITVSTTAGPRQLRGAMTLVLEKSPQGWKIIHDHTSTAAAQEQQE
jgi:beta-aspartyl-peptidase (threonine type)